jgi:hypothetical protein
MSDKLDMFETLKQIDKRNITFIDDLEPDVKKQFVPLLTMRWLSSGTQSQLRLNNAILNPLVFKLHRHPALLYKLMVATSDGKSKRYNWIKKKSKDKSAPTAVAAISTYYQCSKKDAIRFKPRLSVDDVVEMAEEIGYDKEQIKKIKTELK